MTLFIADRAARASSDILPRAMARMPDYCVCALGVPYRHEDQPDLDLCRQVVKADRSQCLRAHPDKNLDALAWPMFSMRFCLMAAESIGQANVFENFDYRAYLCRPS